MQVVSFGNISGVVGGCILLVRSRDALMFLVCSLSSSSSMTWMGACSFYIGAMGGG